jgi:hypothetical protein
LPQPPSFNGSNESAARNDNERVATVSILDSVLELDVDRELASDVRNQAAGKLKVSPMLTITRESRDFRIYKRTYIKERQQLAVGKKLPTSRLEKIVAAAKQQTQEAERTCKRDVDASVGAGSTTNDQADEPSPTQMLRLGSVVALATCTSTGTYEWWAGRVEKMRRPSSRSSRFLDTSDPVLFDEACASKMMVICTWYRKHARYVFTYDGPIDDNEFSMASALGLLDLDLPDEAGRYKLRDRAQGPQFDAALKLTEVPRGKKRTRGEEHLAQDAQLHRETASWLQPSAAKKRRAPAVHV